jgi:hypothetical protein
MTTKTLNRDALQTLKLLRCGPHVLEVIADANAQLVRDEDAMRRQLAEIAAANAETKIWADRYAEEEKKLLAAWKARDIALAIGDEFEAKATALESELFALGVQCEALKERLKLATKTIDALFAAAMAGPTGDSVADAEDAKNAWDAVPGDVSKNLSGGALTAMLEQQHMPGCRVLSGRVDRDFCALCKAAPRVVGTIGGVPVIEDASLPDGVIKDGGPRYASGEVPMVGDVVKGSHTHVIVEGFDIDGDVIVDGDEKLTYKLTLVRRAAPPAPPDWATPWQQSHFAVDPLVLAQAEHIDRLVIQRDAAEALARERLAEVRRLESIVVGATRAVERVRAASVRELSSRTWKEWGAAIQELRQAAANLTQMG